jgi:transcriptional regulator with XRE-family HTH domain
MKKNYLTKVNEIFNDNDLSHEELAVIIGKSRSTVRNYLIGLRPMTVDMLISISNKFKIPIAYFFENDNKTELSLK